MRVLKEMKPELHRNSRKNSRDIFTMISYTWACICKKRLGCPGIDSKELIPPAYVAWRAGTSIRDVVLARQAGNGFLGSLIGLQIMLLFLYAL